MGKNNSKKELKKATNKLVASKYRIIICVILLCATLVSLFFASKLEYLLMLKPDLSVIAEDAFEVHFVSVGQGDCVLVRFPNEKTMIIDAGPPKGKDDMVNYIDNVFFAESEKVFDYAVLTHSDADHSGNMQYIIENYKINNFYRPRAYATGVEPKSTGGISVTTQTYKGVIKALYAADIENVYFNDEENLYINDEQGNRLVTWYTHDTSSVTDNNQYSPIMVISSYDKHICVTGDAGKETEIEVVNKYNMPDVDVLKLGHHGSYTSTDYTFLETITPEYAVVCVGENSYGHPHEDTLKTLIKYDQNYNKTTYSELLTTLDDGNIICYINDNVDIEFTFVDDVNDYIFIKYEWIVLGISIVLITIMIIPKKRKSS